MNAEREMILEDTMQQTLMQMKNNSWSVIEVLSSISTNENYKPEEHLDIFKKPNRDYEHTKILNDMLAYSNSIELNNISIDKCENALAFQYISKYFQSNTDKILMRNKIILFDLSKLMSEISPLICNGTLMLVDDKIFKYIRFEVENCFYVKLMFGFNSQLTLVSAHASSERDKMPFEKSNFRIFNTLTMYFSRVLLDFLNKYNERGIYEFIIWLKSYRNLYSTQCTKCEKIVDRDITGDVLPPIIRTISNCHAYHIKCAPFEIELPDFGYITLVSDEQLRGKYQHLGF